MRVINMKLISVIVLSALLSGCWWNTKEVDITVVTKKQIDTCISPPMARQIIIENIKFKVIEDANGIKWIGLTPHAYEKLAKNMQELLANSKQKNILITYYKECHKEKEKDATAVPK